MRRITKKTPALRAVSLIFSALLLFSVLLPVFAEGETETEAAPEDAPRIEAPQLEHVGSACLYNFETDSVLYELNAEAEVYPTSTVKIMTGIVALEELADRLDEPLTVTEEMLYPVRGNAVGLMAGEIITPRQALYCLLVNNANDAAYVLAFAAAGREEVLYSTDYPGGFSRDQEVQDIHKVVHIPEDFSRIVYSCTRCFCLPPGKNQRHCRKI